MFLQAGSVNFTLGIVLSFLIPTSILPIPPYSRYRKLLINSVGVYVWWPPLYQQSILRSILYIMSCCIVPNQSPYHPFCLPFPCDSLFWTHYPYSLTLILCPGATPHLPQYPSSLVSPCMTTCDQHDHIDQLFMQALTQD